MTLSAWHFWQMTDSWPMRVFCDDGGLVTRQAQRIIALGHRPLA